VARAETWAPAANVYEDEGSYCIIFDLAGVQADSVDLRVEADALVLTGQRIALTLNGQVESFWFAETGAPA